MPRPGHEEDDTHVKQPTPGAIPPHGTNGKRPPALEPPTHQDTGTYEPNFSAPTRDPSGVHVSHHSQAPALSPPGSAPSGAYGEKVRNWGEKQAARDASRGLAPPRRLASNTVGFPHRLDSPLVVTPLNTGESQPELQSMDQEAGSSPPTPPREPSEAGSNFQPPPPTGFRKKPLEETKAEPAHLRHRPGAGGSMVQGKKALRLSVVPVNRASNESMLEKANEFGVVPTNLGSPVSFTPVRLLDIENGTSLLVTNQEFLNEKRYQELGQDGAIVVTARATAPIAAEDDQFFHEREQSLQDRIESGDIRGFDANTEVGWMGGAWRGILRRLLTRSMDDTNGMQLGRQLQLFMPFLTAYEAYLIGQVVEVMDGHVRPAELDFVLKVAFQNRNISRIIVQNIGQRWSFIWHWYNQVTASRRYDTWGQLPVVGITSFPATENFPSTRNHVVASTSRVLFGEGLWLTRVLTQNRQGLNTDNPERNIAQNLAAESNGFELANRNQFGTYIGRNKTNEFRLNHRLPTDESIVRTFVAQPMPTMINNGVVHTLRQLAKHWHNTLSLSSGNFAHQRMEQLDPFETMRFHMPAVCVVLSSLRGRNIWDSQVLGPFMRKCQELRPSTNAMGCRYLVKEMKEQIVVNLCGGVASVVDPLQSWLASILEACDAIEAEASEVYEEVTAVEVGLRLGHDLITQVSWEIHDDQELKNAIVLHILGKNPGPLVNERRIRKAMLLTTPRDKRTLMELVKGGFGKEEPAQLLLGRVKTLLQRELRREALNEAIRELSLGDYATEFVHDEWYWVEEKEKWCVYIYDAKVTGQDLHRVVQVDTGVEKFLPLHEGYVKCRAYIPIAEAITRAQRCYMNIELEHGKKFKYNAFMEFSFLRIALRRLAIVSQMFCDELDNARLNVLTEVQRSNQTQVAIGEMEIGKTYYTYDGAVQSYEPFICEKVYTQQDPEWQSLARSRIVTVPPQSVVVVGGGPTGLMTTIHCTENVLVSGGEMKLYEARDKFSTGGATFERAQIVRLDARWVAMLRYHLGTGFEDIYVPASGETDAQLGNTLPTQGFVEITIKDLESMLHVEVSKMWSKGVIQCFTDSKAHYDVQSNSLTKQGQHLKMGDTILRRVDANGKSSNVHSSWRVAELHYEQPLNLADLLVGHEYGVYVRKEDAVLPFKLSGVDLQSRTYTFVSLQKGGEDLKAAAHNLPSVYPKGTRRHADVNRVVVESVQRSSSGTQTREELPMQKMRNKLFTMDIGNTHVVQCIGKPHGSLVHFSVATQEPYGVCCIQGLKISMGMHNFGEQRWGSGLLDDFRSTNDQNTRIVGDFTKMVRQPHIVGLMLELLETEEWEEHLKHLVSESEFPSLNELDPIVPKLQRAVNWLASNASTFKRQTLQTRFFETGDNYYLGMEFPREYDKWKKATADDLVSSLVMRDMKDNKRKAVARLKETLLHHIDRLWYDACLETIRHGDVYNPGARHRVPRIHTIDSLIDQPLDSLPIGESFRLVHRPNERYEVLLKTKEKVIARNVEGYIYRLEKNAIARREGNLTRGPDGNVESKVALATFPVGHYVNHRTVRVSNEARGYVYAFVGDEQSTPHFMRYSGLTGACINAMLFNNFVKQAISGATFADRLRDYSKETNWSNNEVVTRGTGSNFGEDSFLRPGFPYKDGVAYLYSKALESIETKQGVDDVLSTEWKHKFAASMVPRGMELNEDFIRTLYTKVQQQVFDKFMEEVKRDQHLASDALVGKLLERQDSMEEVRREIRYDSFWVQFILGMEGLDEVTRERLQTFHAEVAQSVEHTIVQIVEVATKGYLYNERCPSEIYNQPKPVDSIVDDFAVEAQNFANSLVMSAAFSAGALAFVLFDLRSDSSRLGDVFAAIIAALNIVLSFGTMANVSRYKIRNEESRILFHDKKFLGVKKAVFALLDHDAQRSASAVDHPYMLELESRANKFLDDLSYYDMEEPLEFKEAFHVLSAQLDNPEAIRAFQKLLSTKFIPDCYHVNSYIQEDLVEIYKTCEELLLLVDKGAGTIHTLEAQHLFERLTSFSPRLSKSLQRGHIYWGFLKRRRIDHWDIFVVLRYFWSLFCWASPHGSNPIAPIQTETLGVLKEAKMVSALNKHDVLRRDIRDLESLYWGTRESDVASMIFVSAFLVHIVSWVFTIARIITLVGGSSTVTDVAFWASLASALGAILAIFHFQRKFFILVRLWWILGVKGSLTKNTDHRGTLRMVKAVTLTQILLTFLRLLSAYAAGVALPWSVARNGYGDKIGTNDEIPFWIALGAVSSAVGSTILFFFVEYVVRYNLSPKLGEHICEAFRDEIEQMYQALSKPFNDIDTKQDQEQGTWEYVAREFLHVYRFDTVFAADRFGSILQYIQSGMDPR